MGNAQLWVWMGSPDDKLDVLRYVKATNQDILGQPVVQAEIAALRAKVERMERVMEAARGLRDGGMGVEFDDERLDYVTIQVDRDALAAFGNALDALGAGREP